MTSRRFTRRAFAAMGSAVAIAGCLGDSGDDDGGGTPTDQRGTAGNKGTPLGESTPVDDKKVTDQALGNWHRAESPTGHTLYDVVVSRAGVFAVGEDGVLVGRCHGMWQTVNESNDLEVAGNTLYDAATPDDGSNVWFCGSSGAFGVYEPKQQRIIDYSAPGSKTSTWETIAVGGTRGDEYIFLGNGSGELLRGKRDGEDIEWGAPKEPGGGSSYTDMEFPTPNVGFLADTSGGLYRTTDSGDDWNKIGVRGAEHALHSIGAADENTVYVSADAGVVYRYNGTTWTQTDAGASGVHGIDIVDRKTGLACTAEGGVYDLQSGRWNRVGKFDGVTLHSIIYGNEAAPHVAVGAGGAIVERFPDGNAD
jgi:photosystem II stability/assembly factor-like uncharacterized protein